MHNFTPISGLLGGALIGLASALLMLLTGRIAGISGIFAGLLPFNTADRDWRIAFLAGLIAAPLLASIAGASLPHPVVPEALWVVVLSGFLVGIGCRMGGGCTSGHGVCGIARFSYVRHGRRRRGLQRWICAGSASRHAVACAAEFLAGAK